MNFLQDLNEFHGNAYGQGLGWLMAAIYMGGRIPQIWLNVLTPYFNFFKLKSLIFLLIYICMYVYLV